MRNLLVILGVLFGTAVFLFLDYTLPSKQTVRIIETYNRIIPIGANKVFFASPDTGTVQSTSDQRDILFINTIRRNGKPRVYRNEDTGWVWPPYFKYSSSDLQGRAADLRSVSSSPRWVSVTSYGWRIPWLSVYPNAVSIKPVAGPEVKPVNWGALISLAVLGLLLGLIWRMWNRFRQRRLQPAVQSVDQAWHRVEQRVEDRTDAARGRWRRWWGRLTGRGAGDRG